MRKRVEELIRESMILEPARPLVSASRLDITLKAGEPYRGSFRVGSPDGSRIRAYVVSDNHRIVIANSISKNPASTWFTALIPPGFPPKTGWRAESAL